MPDGQLADWDILEGSRTVAVVAVTDDERVVLARQYRPGPGRVLLELPGGMVDPGEDVAAAARRELLEETGYTAGSVQVVGQTWLAAYVSSERFAAVATGCRPASADESAGTHADPLEFVEAVTASVDEFRRHVLSGQLTDADIAFMGLVHLGYLRA